MCVFHPAACMVCDWREGYLLAPCEDWMMKSLDPHPHLENNIPPGTHLHCQDLRWPAWGNRKYYICENCLYEMSFLRSAKNEKFYNTILKEIQKRVDQRANQRTAGKGPYIHRSLQSRFCSDSEEYDPEWEFPAKGGFPIYFEDQMAKHGFLNPVAFRHAKTYIDQLYAHPRHDFWEVRADQADSAWLTVWIPQCNICNKVATEIKYEEETDQEIEFEPNAPAWKFIQFIDPDCADDGLWFRVATGTLVKPCLSCRSKEEDFRESITDMMEATNNMTWMQSVLSWLKQRPNDPNVCWNDGWREGALVVPPENKSIPEDFRKELILEAERIMDEKWEELTTTPWQNIDVKPGSVRLFQKLNGTPPQPGSPTGNWVPVTPPVKYKDAGI